MVTRRYLLIFLLPLLIACSGNRLDVDVSAVKQDEVKIDRLEQEMFNSKLTDPRKLELELEKKYGSFYLVLRDIIGGGHATDSTAPMALKMFISDSAMKQAAIDCNTVYPDINWLESDLTDVYKHFKFHFPKRVVPRVVTYMSGFNYRLLPVDSIIGIALEMYLGSDNKFYKMIQFPKYKTMTMTKDYLVSDFAHGWMTTEFPKTDPSKNLLSEIIYNGKQMYLVDALLPNVNDTIKMGYTKKQLDWCKKNEYSMWAYFVQKNVLYDSNPAEIVKYIGEGPFTAAFNKESPSRVGIWIGWQIVRSYMNSHPKVTLEELMNENDAQSLMSQSKYKPSK